ncbi:MAG: HlyD family efflux transporter periplasmic adaptor subunit [Pseudomonadota bacterium]
MKKIIVVLVIAALAGGGYYFFGRKDETTVRVALGTLERDRVTLAATAPELIVSQPVAEGSEVEVGTLLVQLDTTLQQTSLRKIEADIAQQQANLEKLNNGVRTEEITAAAARVDTARSQLLESERDYERTRSIVDRKLAAQATLETAETRRDGNMSRLRDTEAQLALLRAGSRNEDIAQAEAQLVATRALLAAEQQRLNNLSITATVAGRLDSLPWNVGERVATGSQLAVLLAGGAPYARVYIPETSRAAISTGTSLTVHVDGVAEAITGTVRWISSEPAFTPYYALNSSERSRLVYMAEVQLPASATDLPAGLPAQVDLP